MWYYTTDGQQQGPVDDAALDQLVATGAVTPATYLWKDGMPEWKPLNEARLRAMPGAPPEDPALATCSICGKHVGSANLIDLLGRRVCAECKPAAVQALQEGVPLVGKNETAWRDGKKVVTYNHNALPARCFKCNCAVSVPPIKRKVYWHPPAYYLILFFNAIIYAIVAMIVRKRGEVQVYLCEQHARKRKYFIVGSWSVMLLAVLMIMIGIGEGMGILTLSAFVLLVGGIVAGIAGGSLSRTAKIKGDTIWLSGAHREFIASLPPWP